MSSAKPRAPAESDVFILRNMEGHTTEIPLEAAKKYFRTLTDVDAAIATAGNADAPSGVKQNGSTTLEVPIAMEDVEDPEDGVAVNGSEEDEDTHLKLEDLNYPAAVLDAILEYTVMLTENRVSPIPKPLTDPIHMTLKPQQLGMVERAEENNYLVELIDCASVLKFEEMIALCAAYMSSRICEISKRGPNIMAAAENIRKFLHMANDWTPEEMEHLRKEMEYAKSFNPDVY